MSDYSKLQKIILKFPIMELKNILIHAGLHICGRKQELQAKVLDLLRDNPDPIHPIIRQIHEKRVKSKRAKLYSLDPGKDIKKNGSSNSLKSASQTIPSTIDYPQVDITKYEINGIVSLENSTPRTGTIKFELQELPLFDLVEVLLAPYLVSNRPHPSQDLLFYVKPEIIKRLRSNDNEQIQLRFAYISRKKFKFPENISLNMNSYRVPLNHLETPKKVQVVNITKFISGCKNQAQFINLYWTRPENEPIIMAVVLVRVQTVSVLAQNLKDAAVVNPKKTRSLIKEMNLENSDIDVLDLKISLICPLGRRKMTHPCRASTCQHLQCFDAISYLLMNEISPKWICPICRNPAAYKSLEIDGLFLDILEKVPFDCTEVQFEENGWRMVKPAQNVNEIEKSVDDSHLEEYIES